MKLDKTPDSSLNFMQILSFITNKEQLKSFVHLVQQSLEKDIFDHFEDFSNITNDQKIKEKVEKIYSGFISPIDPKKDFIEIHSNNKFILVRNINKIENGMYIFDNMIIMKQGTGQNSIYHLNPNILNLPDFINPENPHQEMDHKIKTKPFLNDSKYGIINKIIYCNYLIENSRKNLPNPNLYENRLFNFNREIERMNCINAIIDDFNKINKVRYNIKAKNLLNRVEETLEENNLPIEFEITLLKSKDILSQVLLETKHDY